MCNLIKILIITYTHTGIPLSSEKHMFIKKELQIFLFLIKEILRYSVGGIKNTALQNKLKLHHDYDLSMC